MNNSNGVVMPPDQEWYADSKQRQDRTKSPSMARYAFSGATAFGAALVVIALASSTGPGNGPDSKASKNTMPMLTSHVKVAEAKRVSAEFAFKATSLKNKHTSARSSPTIELAAGKPPKKFRTARQNLAADNYKVKIRLYMESQCPACKKFSTTYLKQLLATQEMRDIIDFKFVPWGNGQIQDVKTQEILNTTALLTRALNQYVELLAVSNTKTGNPMQKLIGNLEIGIASAWGSLTKELSALKQMDSINPKYKHAKAAEDFKSLWLVSTAPQTLLLQTRDPHPKSVTQRAEFERTLTKLSNKIQLQQANETGNAPGNATGNGSDASDTAYVSAFEEWYAAQPHFDLQAWMASKSNTSANESRSEMQVWLDNQPEFDTEAWLASQPSFDFEEWLNPSSTNGSNASMSIASAEQLHSSEKFSLYQNTVKNVEHLKRLLHKWTALRSSAAYEHHEQVASLAAASAPNLAFACQHGGSECAGNAWEACLQDMYPDEGAFFPVVDCIEKMGCAEGELPPAPGTFAQPGDCAGLPAQVAPGCVVDHGKGVMDGQALQQCVFGVPTTGLQVPRSTVLLLQNALATAKLGTSRQWVPWLTLNDEPVSKNDKEFNQMFLIGSKVCEIYKAKTGKEPPAQCSKFIKIAPEKDFYAAFGDSPAAEPLIKKHGLHNHTSNDPPTPES